MIKYQSESPVNVLNGESAFLLFGLLGGLHYHFWRIYYGVYFKVLFGVVWPLKKAFR
jgi:hypothetical protein